MRLVFKFLSQAQKWPTLRAALLAVILLVPQPRHVSAVAATPQARAMQFARILKTQPKLLQGEIAKLTPHHPGETDVYAIGIAGWGSLDVFLKEVDGGLDALGKMLPINERTLRLINNPTTVTTVPLATLQNFTAAVHAVAGAMDKNNDVFVLLMTSHGDRSGVALELPDRIVDLTPQIVAATLDREGIRNRVVIVSACFSGIFVPPLANESTIVMTAADDRHTSFGCAPERDWTFFGDAFLHQSLKRGTDFQHAFAHARELIAGWEALDRLPRSNPQAYFGKALVARLAPLLASTSAGVMP